MRLFQFSASILPAENRVLQWVTWFSPRWLLFAKSHVLDLKFLFLGVAIEITELTETLCFHFTFFLYWVMLCPESARGFLNSKGVNGGDVDSSGRMWPCACGYRQPAVLGSGDAALCPPAAAHGWALLPSSAHAGHQTHCVPLASRWKQRKKTLEGSCVFPCCSEMLFSSQIASH